MVDATPAAAEKSNRVSHRHSSRRRGRGERRRPDGRRRERRGPLEGICEPGGFVCRKTPTGRSGRGSSFRLPTSDRKASRTSPSRCTPICCARARRRRKKRPTSGERRAGVWRALAGACRAALALALLAAGAFAWRAGYAPRFMAASVDDKLANAPRLSIVVLPFENLSGDKEQDYFADGITEDLTTDLSHLSRASSSPATLPSPTRASRSTRKQIGVNSACAICSKAGAPRRRDDHDQRQLISTETGAHVWADRFESERSKLGEFQVEMSRALAIRSGPNSSRPKPCARCANGRAIPTPWTSRCKERRS